MTRMIWISTPMAWLLAGLLFLGAAVKSVHAGGYMRSGETTYASVGLKMDYGDKFFDKSGSRQGGGCGSGYSVPVYVDHGWSYYTNVFASTSLRYKDCPGQSSMGISDTEVGIRRRVDPISNALVWEASLILPTSKLGATRSSDAATLGYDFSLHWNPRPDPYRLDLDRDPLAGRWSFGTGVRGWTSHLPLEWHAYASYDRPLGLTNWGLGKRAWSFSSTLEWRQSIAQTHATRAAVDSHDQFHLLELNLGFGYPLSRDESFNVSFYQALLGENRDDSSGISVSYGKNFR